MTEPTKPNVRDGFAVTAGAQAILEANESMSGDGGHSIEALVTSILSDKHTLSAEDLAVFQGLLDDPDLDPEQRAEFLQVIWNIVVSIIDYQWDNALTRAAPSPEPNSCGSTEIPVDELACNESNMVQSGDEELSQTHNKAAAELPDQEDGP